MQRPVVLYLHIPKCAGITLSSMVRLNFAGSRTLYPHTLDKPVEEEMRAFPADDLRQARLIWGHYHYGVHRYVPKPYIYVTMLRHPVARVVSLYRYVREATSHPLHDHVHSRQIDLAEYVASSIDKNQTENGQTRQICGMLNGDPDAASLEEAKANLSGFAVVGLVERFDESFVLLRRRLRLKMPFYVNRNVSSSGHDVVGVTDEVKDLIRERNPLDVELYDFARELFEQQLAEEGDDLRRGVARLQRMNQIAGGFGRVAEPLLVRIGRMRAGHRALRVDLTSQSREA